MPSKLAYHLATIQHLTVKVLSFLTGLPVIPNMTVVDQWIHMDTILFSNIIQAVRLFFLELLKVILKIKCFLYGLAKTIITITYQSLSTMRLKTSCF